MKKIDYNKCEFELLEQLIADWEFVHQEANGRLHCDCFECYNEYVKVRNIYNIRKSKEQNKGIIPKHYVTKYKKLEIAINNLKLIQNVELGSTKDIRIGHEVVLVDDPEGHDSVYQVMDVVPYKKNTLRLKFKQLN